MNAAELAANPAAAATVVHDLNADPRLPFPDGSFDAAVCCVSVDYLVRPLEVFADVARVVRPGGPFVATFSNRCFPTKAIRGWLLTTDEQHCEIVTEYFRRAGGWDDAGRGAPHPARPPRRSALRACGPAAARLTVAARAATRLRPMDPELQAKADAEAAALQRDVEFLEHEAAKAGKSLAVKLGPPVAALLRARARRVDLGRRARRGSSSRRPRRRLTAPSFGATRP